MAAKKKPPASSARAQLASDVLWVAAALGAHVREAPTRDKAPTPTAWAWFEAIRQDKTGSIRKEFWGKTLPGLIPKMSALEEEDKGIQGEKFKIEGLGELRVAMRKAREEREAEMAEQAE